MRGAQRAAALTSRLPFISTIRSGVPIAHARESAHWRGGGMSCGLPRGAPLSAHCAISAISSSLSDGSLWNVRGRSSASYPALVYDEAALFA